MGIIILKNPKLKNENGFSYHHHSNNHVSMLGNWTSQPSPINSRWNSPQPYLQTLFPYMPRLLLQCWKQSRFWYIQTVPARWMPGWNVLKYWWNLLRKWFSLYCFCYWRRRFYRLWWLWEIFYWRHCFFPRWE